MNTIKLSDRLELRAYTAPVAGTSPVRLLVDGSHVANVHQSTVDALIALANPPRYDLPPGVEQLPNGTLLCLGRDLPGGGWQRFCLNWDYGWIDNDDGDGTCTVDRDFQDRWYEVRPTAANPIRPLPESTFRLPDGRLACLRRDAAKLREAGAVIRYPNGVGPEYAADNDAKYPTEVCEVRFPPPAPATEDVPWWEAKGRVSPNGYEITDVEWRKHQDHPFFYAKQGWTSTAPDGRVTVLVDGDQR